MELEKEFTARVRSDALLGIKCSGSDRAWMRAVSSNVFLISQSGDVLETVNTKTETHPNDIFVTDNEEVLFTDLQSKAIMKISKDRKIEPFLTTGNFIPLSICCTKDGHVIVSLILESLSSVDNEQVATAKLVKFDNKGQPVQDILLDAKGNPLFKNPEYVCVNHTNENICVSDWGHKTVIVVDSAGQHRFSYEGPPKSIRRYPDFFPRDLTCDTQGRILVVDSGNECIQILSPEGEFLSYLLTDDDGIEDPFTLSFDTSGRLWVGERYSKKVKLFKQLQ